MAGSATDATVQPPPPDADCSPAKLSIAPMMEVTDRHYRAFARLLTKRTTLYTEMVTDQAVLHNHAHLLPHSPHERPLVLQLGGSDPALLAAAAKLAVQDYGYEEINLNCGCPSNKVTLHDFGACLMLKPTLVAQCLAAIRAAVAPGSRAPPPSVGPKPPKRALDADAADDSSPAPLCPVVPVTVKCRIGVDDVDSYPALCAFVSAVASGAGVTHFVVHARKAILKGLSPAENRTVPPLRREVVAALVRDFPGLRFTLNGCVESPAAAAALLADGVCSPSPPPAAPGESPAEGDGRGDSDNGGARWLPHGVMIGRAAWKTPWVMATSDSTVYGQPDPCANRRAALLAFGDYADGFIRDFEFQDVTWDRVIRYQQTMLRPLQHLFAGEAGGRAFRHATVLHFAAWRKQMAALAGAGIRPEPEERGRFSVRELLETAMRCVPESVLDSPPGAPPITKMAPVGSRVAIAAVPEECCAAELDG